MSRKLLISLLVAAISLSPRIPLPLFLETRRFDLRIEDILIVFCILLLMREKIRVHDIYKAYSIYLIIGAAASFFGILVYGIDSGRTLLYLLKEVEFGLLGLLVANWVQTTADLTWVRNTIFMVILLNISWVLFQVISQNPHSLFLVEGDTPYDPSLPLYESYGPGLVGEVGSFQTGQFFLFAFLLALATALASRRQFARWAGILISGLAWVAVVLSASRGSIFGSLIGAVVLLAIWRGRASKQVLTMILIIVVAAVVLSRTGLTTPDRFESGRMGESLVDRIQNYWYPLLANSFPGILVGFGKGSLGFVSASDQEFAHNNYLRIVVESGLCGLIAFLWTLWRAISFCWTTQMGSKQALTKSIAASTLAITIARVIQAFTDDVFAGALVTELWWVFIGLTVAASQIQAISESPAPTPASEVVWVRPLTHKGGVFGSERT